MSTKPRPLPFEIYFVAALLLALGFVLIMDWARFPRAGPDFDLVGGSLCVAGGIGLVARKRFGYIAAICAVLGIGATLATATIPDFFDQLFSVFLASSGEPAWFSGTVVALAVTLLVLVSYVAWREPVLRNRLAQVRAVRAIAAILIWAGGVELLMLILIGPRYFFGSLGLFVPPIIKQLAGDDYYAQSQLAWAAVGAAVVGILAWSARTLLQDDVQVAFEAQHDGETSAEGRAQTSDVRAILTSDVAGRFAVILVPIVLALLVNFILRDIESKPCTTCSGPPPDWLSFGLKILFQAAFIAVCAAFAWLNKRAVVRLATGGTPADMLLFSAAWSIFTVLMNLEIAGVPLIVLRGIPDFAITVLQLEIVLLAGVVALIVRRKAPIWTALPLLLGIPDTIFVFHAISSGWYDTVKLTHGTLCLFVFAYTHASRAAAVGTALQFIVVVSFALRTRAHWLLISCACVLAAVMVTSLLIMGYGLAFDWTDSSCSLEAPGVTSWINYLWP